VRQHHVRLGDKNRRLWLPLVAKVPNPFRAPCEMGGGRESSAQLLGTTLSIADVNLVKYDQILPRSVSGQASHKQLMKHIKCLLLVMPWRANAAGCPTHRALCDVWVLVATGEHLNHERTSLFGTLAICRKTAPTHSQSTRMCGAPGSPPNKT